MLFEVNLNTELRNKKKPNGYKLNSNVLIKYDGGISANSRITKLFEASNAILFTSRVNYAKINSSISNFSGNLFVLEFLFIYVCIIREKEDIVPLLFHTGN